jgi:hypothetical protein
MIIFSENSVDKDKIHQTIFQFKSAIQIRYTTKQSTFHTSLRLCCHKVLSLLKSNNVTFQFY